jgi:Big-like domain-containing protein
LLSNVKRLLLISLALVLPVVAGLSASEQKPRQHRNRPPAINSFTSSAGRIPICEFSPDSNRPEVDLFVNATDPDDDALHYDYSTTDGIISGEGNLVVWALRDVKRGPHEVRVTVTDGRGGKADAALTVITVDHPACDKPPPPCPEIRVSCPDEMDQSKPFIFSALIIEGKAKSYQSPSFRWKLNAGRIVKGQYGPEIEATTTGANGFYKITATVQVGGFDPACITTASCSTKIIW